jgi:hypothetical protein
VTLSQEQINDYRKNGCYACDQGLEDEECSCWKAGAIAEQEAVAKLRAERDALKLTLEYITKKEGRFSMDPHEHARNCIEDMAEVAEEALKGKWCTYVKAALGEGDA